MGDNCLGQVPSFTNYQLPVCSEYWDKTVSQPLKITFPTNQKCCCYFQITWRKMFCLLKKNPFSAVCGWKINATLQCKCTHNIYIKGRKLTRGQQRRAASPKLLNPGDLFQSGVGNLRSICETLTGLCVLCRRCLKSKLSSDPCSNLPNTDLSIQWGFFSLPGNNSSLYSQTQ